MELVTFDDLHWGPQQRIKMVEKICSEGEKLCMLNAAIRVICFFTDIKLACVIEKLWFQTSHQVPLANQPKPNKKEKTYQSRKSEFF